MNQDAREECRKINEELRVTANMLFCIALENERVLKQTCRKLSTISKIVKA